MRRDSLFRLALFATVCLWQAGNAWGQAPPDQAAPSAPAKKGKTRSVTGTVQESESGAAVAGATVKVKGTEIAVQTGAEGTFAVDVPRGEATIEITGPEHMAKEITLTSRQKKVQVSLTRSAPQERIVTGIIKEAGSGRPVANAVVTLKGTSTSATTDEDGLFVLLHVPLADAQLEVTGQGLTAAELAVPAGQSTAKLELQPVGGVAPAEPTAPAQPAPTSTRTITGKVTERGSNDPIPGATISVKGTELTGIAEEDGSYTIDGAPNGPVTLVVTGYTHTPQEIAVPLGMNQANVALELGSSETIVITGRAPVLMKRNLANGASVVNDEDLNRVSSQTLDGALNGKVSGANMQSNSGAPGGGTQLRLRGISTINGQSSPLYVIDGVILSNVSVASGANLVTAAAAGGSASNQDNPVNRIADLNPNDIENVEILKGPSAAALYGSAAANGVVIITTKRGKPGAATKVNVTQRVGFSQVSNTLGSRQFESAEEVLAAYDDPALSAMFTGDSFDHEKQMTQTPVAYETIASASGGNENGNYSGSILVRDEPGVLKGTFYEKQAAKLGVAYNFGDKLQVSGTTQLIHSLTDRGLTNNDNTGTSMYVALSSTPSFLDLAQRSDGTFPDNPMASSNPLQTVALLQNEEDVWRLIGSATANYKLFEDDMNAVNLQSNFGADRFQQVNDLFAPPELQFEDDDGLPGTSVEATTQNLNYNVGVGAVWTLTPTSKAWRSALSTGFTYGSVDLTSVYVFAENLNAGQPNVDSGVALNTTENHLRTKDQGIYLQEEVALLEDRLTLLGGALAERSSLNGDTDKFYLFPKVAVTYRLPVAEELFNPLRVRAAYGEAGNRPNYGQKFTSLSAINTIDGSPGLVIGGVGGIPTAGDPDIEPERQREFELGVDAAMEDQRVVLELSVYQRDISNMLLQRALPTSTGFTTLFENGGEMRNRGVETSLQVIPIMQPLEWTSRAILTLNRSEVTDLPGDPFNVATVGFGAGLGAYRIEEGKSATQIVSDVDGDGVPDVIGNGEPDFRLGFSNEFKFGDFGVFSLIDWQQGSEIINLTRLLYDFGQVTEDYVGAGEARLDSFNMGDIRPYVEDATFIKLREVSVYYDIPESVATQIGPLNTLRVSLQGRNLLTFTDYSGLDPEVSNFGNQAIGRNYDVAPYPPSRSFWLSVDAGF
jgi:TonB-linked SusC/RagA family outer membrane protein